MDRATAQGMNKDALVDYVSSKHGSSKPPIHPLSPVDRQGVRAATTLVEASIVGPLLMGSKENPVPVYETMKTEGMSQGMRRWYYVFRGDGGDSWWKLAVAGAILRVVAGKKRLGPISGR